MGGQADSEKVTVFTAFESSLLEIKLFLGTVWLEDYSS